MKFPKEIGGAFYINLERRKDRRLQFEEEMTKAGIEGVERFQAIERNPGILGCGLSHLAILKIAREKEWPAVAIFEDDFEFLISPDEFDEELRVFFSTHEKWDVLMLSYSINNGKPYTDRLIKVLDAQTASGYIVNAPFYDTLITLYEDAMVNLEKTGKHWIYANDQIWKTIQPAADWYALKKRAGKQRKSHSDLAGKVMDYGV
jgi:glycosyl transferase, family 25